MCRPFLVAAILLTGCMGEISGQGTPEGNPDAGLPTMSDAAPPRPDAGGGGDAGILPGDGVAPPGVVSGARPAADGDNELTLSATPTILRVEAEPTEHVAFVLSFSGNSGVVMAVDRWDGFEVKEIGLTNAGAGLRHLAVFDPGARRTYWVRAHSTGSGAAKLTMTRTKFNDGPKCKADCARLMQMPLPNDPSFDGYETDSGTIFRYWFGRRDLVMAVRRSARGRALEGQTPIFPYDFSQWDGLTPGVDVGSPRHASHQRGKDVDISLYGQDGVAPWRSYCETHYTSSGRECLSGTRKNFDGRQNVLAFASELESGRVTMSFLDRELIPAMKTAAAQLADEGKLDRALLPLYGDGKHIQHWPNHDNHIHVRVSEEPYDAKITWEAPFEAP